MLLHFSLIGVVFYKYDCSEDVLEKRENSRVEVLELVQFLCFVSRVPLNEENMNRVGN